MDELFKVSKIGRFDAKAEYLAARSDATEDVQKRLARVLGRVNRAYYRNGFAGFGSAWVPPDIYKLRVAPFEIFVICAPENNIRAGILYVAKKDRPAELIAETDVAKARRDVLRAKG